MRFALLPAVLCLSLAACTKTTTAPKTVVVTTPAESALTLSSTVACTTDADCAATLSCFQGQCVHECSADTDCQAGETCSANSRCVVGNSPATVEAYAKLHLTNVPQGVFFVTAGQPSVSLHLEFDGAIPTAGLSYRVERSDDSAAGAALRRAQGTTSVDLVIAVGLADPAKGAAAQVVDTTVYTAVGRFPVRLTPARPVSGQYSGSLALTNLGTVPVEFQLVTDPPNAGLADATSSWVVLEVSDAGFLSPADLASLDGGTQLAAPVSFEPISGKYVARFNHAYPLAGGASAVFSPPAGTVGRGLRFELVPGPNGAIGGSVVDVWSGLYELQGLTAAPAPATTYQVGTLDVSRTGSGLSVSEVQGLPSGAPPATPVAQAAAPLDACSSALLNALAPSCHDSDPGTDDLLIFAGSPAAQRAACANDAVAQALLAGGTVTAKLAEYTSATAPTAGSFQTFLGDCSAGTNGTCVPSATILCARQLAAHAYQGLDSNPALGNVVLKSYLDATREATLGPQLAAFWADYQARLDWLTTDGAPSIIASALTADSLARLTAWRSAVLDRHLATLAVQLDASARAVYARVPTDATLASSRANALVQLSQTWRGATDALTFMVRRWNVLSQDTASRAAAASEARVRSRDLYLIAAVVTGLTQTNGALATASFHGAFGDLVRGIAALELPFQNLVFARDAEVVVSTSLDPASSTAMILGQRQASALAAVEAARTSVNTVVDGVIADGVTQLQLSGSLAIELQAAQADLQKLCGLPAGCTAAQLGTTPQCAPRVTVGTCGFDVDQATGSPNFQAAASASRAGAQVLEVVKAGKALSIAAAARDAQTNVVAYSQSNLEAFAQSVKKWNDDRAAGLTQMRGLYSTMTSIRSSNLATIIAKQKAQADARAASIASDTASVSQWNTVLTGAASTSFEDLLQANKDTTVAESYKSAAEVTQFVVQGTINPTDMEEFLAGAAVSTALRAGQVSAEALAANLRTSAQRVQTNANVQVQNLMAAASVGDAQTASDIAALQAAIDEAKDESAAQLANLNQLVEVSKQQLADELAFGRDLAELNDKRLAHFALLQQLPRFSLEVDQAALGVQQRILEYQLTVQDAQLAESRRALIAAQYSNSSSLLGSPAVVFSRVNRLDRADLYMQTARDALMDWLTALEYLAVRPFVDHRMRILLARNPAQLQRIAVALQQVQNTCGGNTSQATLDVSVRDQLLGLDQPITDVDGSTLTPAARFNAVLQRGNVPIDRRVRYSTDQTVGGLLSRNSGVLAASFSLSLSDFGNLALACNAKMVGFDVSLVGAIGTGLPVVTVLYDGTSQVRSCQPDIDSYVASVGGNTWTHFGSTTLFHGPGRSASPNAGINGYLAGNNTNVTLDGLALASEYTVLIDTTVGDNAHLDWSKLEDVRLRITYGYQDLFAPGQCRE